MKMSEMSANTLRILHLPPELSDERRDQLFKKYNAVKTKTVRKSAKYTITFAEFPSKEIATEAFLRLHQLELKGHRLSIDFAKQSISADYTKADSSNEIKEEQEAKKENVQKTHLQNFLRKLNSWTASNVFTQPPNPSIWYRYPPPTKDTLLRICVQLVKEPTFYTQVLHLMNRMNLPPPFEEMETEFPFLREVYNVDQYKNIFGVEEMSQTESIHNKESQERGEEEEEESEIESEEEPSTKIQNIIPMKRKKTSSQRRLKIPKFVNPKKQVPIPSTFTQRPLRPEDFFESIDKKQTKKVELKIVSNAPLLESGSFHVVNDNQEGGFGLIFPAHKAEVKSTDETHKGKNERNQEFITSEQLASNRISAKDHEKFPVFNNYHPGKPSCRLYIKNLAKQIELKDLHFIYKKYFIENFDSEESQYCVKLMDRGRMKGQAFVTLQTVKQAELALTETNGYILKDKPMVVQFAKTS